MYRKRISKQSKYRSIILAIVVFSTVLIASVIYAALHHSYRIVPTTSPNNTVFSKDTNIGNSGQKTTTSTTTATSVVSSKQAENSSTTDAKLKAPSGTFVSSHTLALKNKVIPSTELSVCNTTPGATCEINLVKGNDTRILSAQIADINGNVYWNWDVNSAGLSVGKWTINVVAKLAGSSLTTTDQLSLDVQP